MTRPLLLTAALGIVASIACFAIAFSLGGFKMHDWLIHLDDGGYSGPRVFGGGPTVTRNLTWTGGDALTLAAPADVVFTQGPDAKVTVTGPQGTADALELDDGRLRLRHGVHHAGRLQITVTAPGVHEFTVAGSGDMRLEGLDQDSVAIKIFGSGDITAKGKARDLEVNIAGSGDAALGDLAVDNADVHIAGSGDATVAPRERADTKIAGSGDVTLVTEPHSLDTNVMGSGHVVHRAQAAPAAPAAPSAPAAPPPPAAPAAEKI